MGNIIAKFQEKIFFSRKEGEVVKNDFCFSFYKISDSVNKQDFSNNIESVYPKVYIQGLEQLFDDDGSIGYEMENFANALNASNEDWSVSYVDTETYGKCIVITCSANKLDDTFTVNFQVPYKYEFSSKFKDKKAISIITHFDDFNTLCPDIPQNITQQYFITAIELPYIDDFAVIDSKGNRVRTVPKGELVEITWSVGNTNNTSASLCDERGNIVANAPSYKVQINEDRWFTLNLEKDGRIVSQILPVNQISAVEIAVFNSYGKRVSSIYKGDTARIELFEKDEKNCILTLYMCENEIDTKMTPPYKVKIDKDTKFKLEQKKDDCVAIQEFTIYSTQWKKTSIYNKMPFKPNDKGYNKFYYLARDSKFNQDKDYYIFIYPNLFRSTTLEEWTSVNDPNLLPKGIICVASENIIYFNYNIESYNNSDNKVYNVCLTYKDKDENKVIRSNISNKLSNTYVKSNPKNKILFGHVDSKCFVVYEHNIEIYKEEFKLFTSITLPEDAANATIVSIDTLSQLSLLAILCNNGCIYILEQKASANVLATIKLERNDQKRVFLIKTDALYVVLENYVFKLNEKFEVESVETHFSPLDTLPKYSEKFMIVGNDSSALYAIVGYGEEMSLWTYK